MVGLFFVSLKKQVNVFRVGERQVKLSWFGKQNLPDHHNLGHDAYY
jgi:hypothetical protein